MAEADRGWFITFEGGDGSGKSTQARRFADRLRGAGCEVRLTQEPGGTEIGRQLREIVLHHRGEVDARAESLLYAADRAQHVATVVRPALAAGVTVVQDRYLDSSIVYQGAGRELGSERVRDLSLWATGRLLPDVTVLLDLPAAEAATRLPGARHRFDRLEAESIEFHDRVRHAYLRLAEAEPDRFIVVDAAPAPDEVADEIWSRLQRRMSERRGTVHS